MYPDGELAAETFRVIGEAMAHKNKVGLGRVTMSGRERLVLVEPRDAGLVMSTVRSADEVRPAEFGPPAKGEIDPDMVAIAETIIDRRSGAFDPATFRDRYQDALRELVAQKTKGQGVAPREVAEPPKVINLMDALKRSLAQEEEGAGAGKGSRRQTDPRAGRLRPASEGAAAAGIGRAARRKRSRAAEPAPPPPRGAERPDRAVGGPHTPALSPKAGTQKRPACHCRPGSRFAGMTNFGGSCYPDIGGAALGPANIRNAPFRAANAGGRLGRRHHPGGAAVVEMCARSVFVQRGRCRALSPGRRRRGGKCTRPCAARIARSSRNAVSSGERVQ